jgi:hypothetical protein
MKRFVVKELDESRQNLKQVCTFRNLVDNEDVNEVWEDMRENIKVTAKDSLVQHQLQQHKP